MVEELNALAVAAVLQLKNAPDLTKVPVDGPSYKEKGNQKQGQDQQQLEATKQYSEVRAQSVITAMSLNLMAPCTVLHAGNTFGCACTYI